MTITKAFAQKQKKLTKQDVQIILNAMDRNLKSDRTMRIIDAYMDAGFHKDGIKVPSNKKQKPQTIKYTLILEFDIPECDQQ